MLPSGTSSNEAVHAEMRPWFSNISWSYQSTLLLKLRVFGLVKLLTHNRALHCPTTAQHNQGTVLHRVVSAMKLWTAESWREWCKASIGGVTLPRGHALQLALKRKRHEAGSCLSNNTCANQTTFVHTCIRVLVMCQDR
jgi:hypothetical protein